MRFAAVIALSVLILLAGEYPSPASGGRRCAASEDSDRYATQLRRSWQQAGVLPVVPAPRSNYAAPAYYRGRDAAGKSAGRGDVPACGASDHRTEAFFDWFGVGVKIHFPSSRPLLTDCSADALAALWTQFSDGRMDDALSELLALRSAMQLCDWAFLQLLSRSASEYYGAENNSSRLLTAFLYCQSGYDMRLAVTEGPQTLEDSQSGGEPGLYMLYHSESVIYGARYFSSGGKFYYALGNPGESRMKVCAASFPGNVPLALDFAGPMNFSFSPSPRRNVEMADPHTRIQLQANLNLIDFYRSYPVSDKGGDFLGRWVRCASRPLDPMTQTLLYPQLRRMLDGSAGAERVGRLLNFVQTAFEYAPDDRVWGRERIFFPEETLHYPFSDCEDRAILLSRLVADLTGLDVALVYFPGHLAVAVHFDEDVPGDSLLIDGRRFVICDPAYIGAPVGTTLPGMELDDARGMEVR